MRERFLLTLPSFLPPSIPPSFLHYVLLMNTPTYIYTQTKPTCFHSSKLTLPSSSSSSNTQINKRTYKFCEPFEMMRSMIGKPSESNEAVYKGVRKRKWGKWVSEIRLPNSRERIWLGSYDTPEKAARAFDAALFCLRGRGAKFNFPDNPPDIPNGHSLSRSEIQAAAHRYANESHEEEESRFRPENQSDYGSPSLVQVDSGGHDKYPMRTSSMDWGFLDYSTTGSSSSTHMSDFDVFSGVNDFPGEFLPLPTAPEIDYGDENDSGGGFFNHHHHSSSLWNF